MQCKLWSVNFSCRAGLLWNSISPSIHSELKGHNCDHFFTTRTHLKLVEIFISFERPYFSFLYVSYINILTFYDPIRCNYGEINDKTSKMHYFLFTTEISRYRYFAHLLELRFYRFNEKNRGFLLI